MQSSKLCALGATLTLASATAAMAAATQVNIADPTNVNRRAQVEPGGRLAVQQVEPTSFFHSTTLGFTHASGCVLIAAPPSGKALIVHEVRIDAYADPSPGESQNVVMYAGTDCTGAIIGDVNPPSLGATTVPFDPGLAVPSGSGLSANINGNVAVEVYVDGYSVASSVAPAVGQTFVVHGRPQQR